MKKIVFVRHGQSVANAGGVTMEHAEIPLSPLGMQQAALLAPRLDKNPKSVLVSSYQRTSETAAPYCELIGRKPTIHHLLHEFYTIDPALMQGMQGEERRPLVETYWKLADPQHRMGERAESFEDFVGRVAEFRTDHLPALEHGTVVFGHGMWIGLMCWQLMGFDTDGSHGMRMFRRFQSGFPMPNCAVYTLTNHSSSNWGIQFDNETYRHIAKP